MGCFDQSLRIIPVHTRQMCRYVQIQSVSTFGSLTDANLYSGLGIRSIEL